MSDNQETKGSAEEQTGVYMREATPEEQEQINEIERERESAAENDALREQAQRDQAMKDLGLQDDVTKAKAAETEDSAANAGAKPMHSPFDVDPDNEDFEYWRGHYDSLRQHQGNLSGRLGNVTAERNRMGRRIQELEAELAQARAAGGAAELPMFSTDEWKEFEESDPSTAKMMKSMMTQQMAALQPQQQAQGQPGAPVGHDDNRHWIFMQRVEELQPGSNAFVAAPETQQFIQQLQMMQSRANVEDPLLVLGASDDPRDGALFAVQLRERMQQMGAFNGQQQQQQAQQQQQPPAQQQGQAAGPPTGLGRLGIRPTTGRGAGGASGPEVLSEQEQIDRAVRRSGFGFLEG